MKGSVLPEIVKELCSHYEQETPREFKQAIVELQGFLMRHSGSEDKLLMVEMSEKLNILYRFFDELDYWEIPGGKEVRRK